MRGFLPTLSADDWQRPSACDLWAIRDVVAHLIWAADFYTDTVSRGMQGDISQPADRPPGDALEPAAMPTYFDQQALRVRDRVGATLLPTFRASYQSLSHLMLGLSPQEWERSCAFFRHYGGQQPAQTFLFLIIQELVIHGWDIRSRFDEAAPLAVESLPPLLERIPNRFPRMPGLSQFPIDTARWPFVRYQFDLEADYAMRYDMVVEGGKARMGPSGKEPADVTLHCDRATFVLMMYKRLTLPETWPNARRQATGATAHCHKEGSTMSEILEDFSPPAVVAALEANILETFPRLGHTSHGHIQESSEVVWYSTGVAFGFYNMVVRAHFAPDDAPTKIADIMGHFQGV